MILLTGGTGTVGTALRGRLIAADESVRCLVREPRRLGPDRVAVQVALGDLADVASFRNALRGVDTVVHLAATIRDQPGASIERINALATYELARQAALAGVRRFVFFSALGASQQSPARFMRSKALAQRFVERSPLETLVFLPSLVYASGDPWLRLLQALSRLPVMPVPGSGTSMYQPVWAEDAAAAVASALAQDHWPTRPYELAGPRQLSHDEILRLILRSLGRSRRLLHVPLAAVRLALAGTEHVAGMRAFATFDEAMLMEISMTSPRGTDDLKLLGVTPHTMESVLGLGG